MSIGKKLRELLKIQNIGEIDLAEHLGISPTRLSDYLNDKREPSFETLNKIAKYFSVSMDYFADYPTDMQEQPCFGITLGHIEDIYSTLDNHQKLVDYLIYGIADLSEETISDKDVYTYMLELSNAYVEEICKELDGYILCERKRILGVET